MPSTTFEIERTRAEFCNVVLDNDCLAAPADYGEKPNADYPGTRARCYACGLAVCTSCSTVRLYYGHSRRICATCESERFEDGEARLLLRAYHRAGYPNVTLTAVKAELAGDAAATREAMREIDLEA
jgi:hypothetical protein